MRVSLLLTHTFATCSALRVARNRLAPDLARQSRLFRIDRESGHMRAVDGCVGRSTFHLSCTMKHRKRLKEAPRAAVRPPRWQYLDTSATAASLLANLPHSPTAYGRCRSGFPIFRTGRRASSTCGGSQEPSRAFGMPPAPDGAEQRWFERRSRRRGASRSLRCSGPNGFE